MNHPPPDPPFQQGDVHLAVEDPRVRLAPPISSKAHADNPQRSPSDYKPILEDNIAYPARAEAHVRIV